MVAHCGRLRQHFYIFALMQIHAVARRFQARRRSTAVAARSYTQKGKASAPRAILYLRVCGSDQLFELDFSAGLLKLLLEALGVSLGNAFLDN